MNFKSFIQRSLLRLRHWGWFILYVLLYTAVSAFIPWEKSIYYRIISGFVFYFGMAVLIYVLTFTAHSNYGQLPLGFYRKSKRGKLYAVISLSIGFILISLLLSAYFSNDDVSDFPKVLGVTLTKDVGAPFTILIGGASLVGLYMTFQFIGSEKREIKSFAEFIKRASSIIKDQSKAKQRTRFMALTPATGCLVLNEDLWRDFADLLRKNSSLIELTCLDEKTTKAWFDHYIPDGNGKEDMEKRVSYGLEAVEDIFKDLVSQNQRDAKKFPEPLRGEWNDLPHAYYLATKDTAIVVTPFFLPSYRRNPFKDTNFAQVNMIGFETSDVTIVEAVNREIDLRRKSIRERNVVPSVLKSSEDTSTTVSSNTSKKTPKSEQSNKEETTESSNQDD